jgi:molybdopterin molybdotransferase
MSFQTIEYATVEQAWAALGALVRPVATCELPVEQAVGHVLARDAHLAHDFPPFARAMMDGYAVRASDFDAGPAKLTVSGLVRAGFVGQAPVTPGTCLRINTGAPLPQGADAVVIVEKSSDAGDGAVLLEDSPTVGQHIEPRAHLRGAGDLISRGGARIDAGTLAALVAGGAATSTVFRRPTVGVLSTGDEIVAAGEPLKPGQIHDSNRVGLQQLIACAGGEPVALGRCPDDPLALDERLRAGLNSDILCVIGGMSKGSHDLVPSALEQLGVEWLVSGLNLKPGKPARIGRGPDGGWVVGLPGNPVSAAVCFLLLVRPIMDGLQGLGAKPPIEMRATLEGELPPNGARPMFQPARWIANNDGESCIVPGSWRGSGDPFGLVDTNALVRRPANAPAAPRGESVLFIPTGQPQ